MKKDSVIIFDFDGTIADTMNYITDILRELSDEFEFNKLKKEYLRELKGKETKEVFKKIGIPLIKVPRILKKVRSLLWAKIEKIKPVKGIEKALYQLRNNNYTLGILTSSPRETVEKFLERNNLNLFDFIYSESNIFNKGKTMDTLINERKINPNNVFYVGDETRDIEAAKRARVKAIAVTWGFNNEKILREWNPDFLVKRPEELVEIINNFC